MDTKNNDQEEAFWQRLSKALFGVTRTTDEGLFAYRVMDQVRRLELVLEEMTWHRFLRWAVPMLGAGAASLILAARIPVPAAAPAMESALFSQQSSDEDPLSHVLEAFQ
jgi:hypothetical protein